MITRTVPTQNPSRKSRFIDGRFRKMARVRQIASSSLRSNVRGLAQHNGRQTIFLYVFVKLYMSTISPLIKANSLAPF